MIYQSKLLYLTLFSSLSLIGTSDSPANRSSLEKRSTSGLLGALAGMGGGGETKTLKDPCGFIDLTPETWQELGIDQYLAQYPDGDKLTLQDFAAQLNVPNFFCGVGMQCSAGQLCSPARGINWIILYAIQEWNNYMNSLYKAVETAISLVKDAASSIVSDFTSVMPPKDQLYGWTVADIVCGVLASITAIMVPAFIPPDAVQVAAANLASMTALAATADMGIGKIRNPPNKAKTYDAAKAALDARDDPAFERLQTEKDDATLGSFFAQPRLLLTDSSDHKGSATSLPTSPKVPHDNDLKQHHEKDAHGDEGTGTHKREKRSLGIHHKDGHYSSYAYTRFAYLEVRLSGIQNRIQSFIAVNFKMATMSPILSKNGLAEIMQGGSFLNPNPDPNQLQQGGKDLAQITVLSQLLQSMKFFVTIGSDECKSKGPNGAWNKKDRLSYCTPEGLMMNIIQAQQDTSINKIPNAHLLREKYGYSTQYLTSLAWDCQKKYGVYTNSTAPPPVSMRSDCIFAIPVCDCTRDEVAKLRKKGKTTVEACRIGANLPI